MKPMSQPETLNPIIHPDALYVHLPFCAALCTYCDFASEVYAAARALRYLDALERELTARVTAGFAPRTIFLGGGTPSALNLTELSRFFEILEKHVDRSRVEEFTIEANPGSTEAAKLEFLLKHGVSRISFGVQSFQPHLLKLLGRIHGADQGREAVRLARAAGFDNISIDLMHGLPTQSLDDLRRDLEEALALGTRHLSAYGLIYEDGTPLKGAVERGQIQRLSPEEESAHYRAVMDALEGGGLPQYEISNYAQPGFEAKHNLVYWRNEAYLGVGVSAASFMGFERTVNFVEMDKYMVAAEQGSKGAGEQGSIEILGAIESREQLDAHARSREALILELRLRRGVDPNEFRARWGEDPLHDSPAFARHLAAGLMEHLPNGRVRLTREALPVADGVLSDFV